MNPVILADNIIAGATITATSTDTGYSVAHLTDRRPYTYWRATSTATQTIHIDCGTAKAADAFGYVGHNLQTAGATIKLESSTDNSTWTTRVTAYTPNKDRAHIKTFTAATARYWRIIIAGATVAPELAVAMIGTRLEFPYPPNAGFNQFKETTEEDTTISKSGHALGTVVRHWPVTISPAWDDLTRTWVTTYFVPFWETYGRMRLYHFWAWDLGAYPDQVFFVRQTGAFELPVKVLAYIDRLKIEMKGNAEL